MAIRIQFITVIVRLDRIAAAPGLEAELAHRFPNAWRDDHLWAFAAMVPPHHIISVFEAAGLTLRDFSSGERRWKDVCIVDYYNGPTNPCDWLSVDDHQKIAWLAGTAPGAVAEPTRLHEANPVLLPIGGSAPPPAQPSMPHSYPTPVAVAQPRVGAPAVAQPHVGAPAVAPCTNFDPAEESKWRTWRIAGLSLLLLHGIYAAVARELLSAGPSTLELAYIFPELVLVNLLLYVELALIGAALLLQVRGLQSPAYKKPGTAVFLVNHTGGAMEGMYVGGGLAMGVLGNFTPGSFGSVASIVHILGFASVMFLIFSVLPILLIASRDTVVIDGQQRVATRVGWWLRRLPFEQIQGLGLFSVKNVRSGNVADFVGLFPKSGTPWKLHQIVRHDLPTEIARITYATGLQP